MRKRGVGIVGTGRVGSALARELSRSGWRISGLYDIDSERAGEIARSVPTGSFESLETLARRSDILFLTVPDGELASVAENLGELPRYRARFLFHTSGIMPARLLRLAGLDRAVYSLHPFGAIARDAPGNPFRGMYMSGEGDEAARPIAESIADDPDCRFAEISESGKGASHLAASLVANHIFALFAPAEELLEDAGIEKARAKSMILRLASSALFNYDRSGLRGLTGPAVRGDDLTIAEHLITAERFGLKDLYEAGLRELLKIRDKNRGD